MNKSVLATTYNFEFYDGTTCEMTLAFIRLKRLASKNKSVYERAQKALSNGVKDEFDILAILYAAYLCANLDAENILTEDEFIEKCGSNRQAIIDAMRALTNPKKQTASASRS